MATIQELLNIGKEKLENTGNEYAKYERKVLLEEVLGCNYMFMLMNPDEEVSLKKETEYLRLIEERCKHYPLQYLLGYAHCNGFVSKRQAMYTERTGCTRDYHVLIA